MRSLLVLIDGLGDDPIPEWGGRTPFAQACHPHMDRLAFRGGISEVSVCEDDLAPESCSCILRLLGVGKEEMPLNRAYLELLAHNRDISEYEMVLRCNLVAVDAQGRLAAFNGRGLTGGEMAAAAAACDKILQEIEFIHLSDYRNQLVLDKQTKILECAVTPPHESMGEDMRQLLAEIRHSSLALDYFLREAELRLRTFAREGFSYALYPWGASARQALPSFYALHKLHGAVVCKAEIVRGIAGALHMEMSQPAGTTGDLDTDIAAKAAAVLALLRHNDFVLAHFNGSDEAAHRCDAAGKAAFIERIDREFLGYLEANINEPVKVLVCGDHVTSSVSGRHGRGRVPVIAGCLNAFCKGIHIGSYRDILKFLYGGE